MYEYTISEDSGGVTVEVMLTPNHHGATHHKPLALALLDVLNNDHFQADIRNAAYGSVVDVSFHAPPADGNTVIFGRFRLTSPDHFEIQNLAGQAQRFLERRLTEAVDAFNMVLAVGTVDPYKARLRHQQERR